MDGTLIDSEPYWMASETSLVESFGGVWTHEDGLQMVGSSLVGAAAILQTYGVAMPIDEIVAHMVGAVSQELRRHVPWQPGAFALLQELGDAGIPTALVTMSYTELARIVVDGAPAGCFQAVITGDAVTRGKPHPEPYLAAARALGVPIEQCLAIEDSLTGLQSAMASGAVSVAVPHMVPISDQPGATVIPSLGGVGIAELDEIFAAARVQARLTVRD
ncbi:hypothetical protein GCM10010401_23340 [Rarobacter faecitabidus]